MKNNCNEIAYFNHYAKHTYYVVLAWIEIQDILIKNNLITKDEFNKINNLIILHDNSKISLEEWLPYARKFYPTNKLNINEIEKEFKIAVTHHKNINLHHFENLKSYTGSDWKCYIIEMICDYIAMGWEFNNYIFEYYEKNKEKISLPKIYQEYLDLVLNTLKKSKAINFIEKPLTRKRIVYLEFFK